MHKPFSSTKKAGGVIVGAVASAKYLQNKNQKKDKKRKADNVEDEDDKDLIREPKRRRQSRKKSMSKAEQLLMDDLVESEPLIPSPKRSPKVVPKTPSPESEELTYTPAHVSQIPIIPILPSIPVTKERVRQPSPDQNSLQIETRRTKRSPRTKSSNHIDELLENRVYRHPEKPLRPPPTVTLAQFEKQNVAIEKKQDPIPLIFERPSTSFRQSKAAYVLVGVIITLLTVAAFSKYTSYHHESQRREQSFIIPKWPVAEASEYIYDDVFYDELVPYNGSQNALCVIDARNERDIIDILLRLRRNFNEFKKLQIKASSYLRKRAARNK
jgi:hypothetical protein